MSAASPSRRLGREQRIRRGRDFMRARESGRRIVSGCLIFNWVETGPGHAPRVGIITTRKLGNAVVRSRARRLLREAFRHNQAEFTRTIDLVLVARNSIVGKGLAGVEADLCAAARRAGLLNERSTATGSA
jgi:ribonuclease P protein component